MDVDVSICSQTPSPPTVYEFLFWICIPCNGLDIITNAQLLNYRPWRGKMTRGNLQACVSAIHAFDCFLLQITSGMHCGYTVALRPE